MGHIRTIVTYTAPPSAGLAAFTGMVAALHGDVNLMVVCGVLAVSLLALDMWLGRS